MHFACDGCAHGVERDPITLMIDLQARGSIPSIDTLERRMRCSVCGRRGATITACEPSD